MNKRYLLFFSLILLLTGFPVLAAPLITLPKGDMSCSVDVTVNQAPSSTQPASPKTEIPQMKHVEIAQVGNLRRDTITWSDGDKTETWKVLNTGFSLVEVTYPAKCIYDVPAGSFMGSYFSRKILDLTPASTSWITVASLVGQTDHDGKPAIHYRASVVVPSNVPHQAPRQVFYEAWVDAKTLIPMAFDDGDYVYELTFSDPPTAPLVMPERFQENFRYYTRANTIARHL